MTAACGVSGTFHLGLEHTARVEYGREGASPISSSQTSPKISLHLTPTSTSILQRQAKTGTPSPEVLDVEGNGIY